MTSIPKVTLLHIYYWHFFIYLANINLRAIYFYIIIIKLI